MKVKSSAWVIGAVLIGAMGTSGCATKGFVRKNVAVVDQKVEATQSQVNAQGGRLDQHDAQLASLDKTSREALDRATAAGKLAEGKFLYSMVLQDDGVKFKTAKYALTPEAKARLDDMVGKLKSENKNVYLEIQGHTDGTGSPEGNKRLGEERAEAVRLYLNQHGVALNRMATISYGKDDPVANNHSRSGRAQNRRVVIVVLA